MFRRTPKGRDAILQKSHDLTQSERLLLALADGTTSSKEMKLKVKGMIERRFQLALADLTAKGLLEKKALESDPQENDGLDLSTLEHFVRQDPLDPVTISSLCVQSSARRWKEGSASPQIEDEPSAISPSDKGQGSDIKTVDFYLPLETASPERLDAVPKSKVDSGADVTVKNDGSDAALQRRIKRNGRARRIQIGYWLLFAGLVCLTVLMVALRAQ